MTHSVHINVQKTVIITFFKQKGVKSREMTSNQKLSVKKSTSITYDLVKNNSAENL